MRTQVRLSLLLLLISLASADLSEPPQLLADSEKGSRLLKPGNDINYVDKFIALLKPALEAPNKWVGEWQLSKKTNKTTTLFNKPPSDHGLAVIRMFDLEGQGLFKRMIIMTLNEDEYVDSPRWVFYFDLDQLAADKGLARLTANIKLHSGVSPYGFVLNWPWVTFLNNIVQVSSINFTIDLSAVAPIDFTKKTTIDPRRESIKFKIWVEPQNSSLYEIQINPRQPATDTENYFWLVLVSLVIIAITLPQKLSTMDEFYASHTGFTQNIGVEVHYLMMYSHFVILNTQFFMFRITNPEGYFQRSIFICVHGLHVAVTIMRTWFMFEREVKKRNFKWFYLSAFFWVGLTFVFVSVLMFDRRKLMNELFVLYSFPLIQLIYTTILAKNRNVFYFTYQVISWLPIILTGLATKGIGLDFIKFKPNHYFAAYIFFSWLFVSVIMWMQNNKGLYFFIPKSYLELRKAREVPHVQLAGLRPNCQICINLPAGNNHELQELINDMNRRFKRTPCGHLFHAECLDERLDNNYECPVETCRRRLLPDVEGW